jgi:hypothetical protein
MALTWTNIYGDDRADLLAFFLRLNGKEHRVRLRFYGQQQRGSLGGAPVVDGAGQTGNTLNITGATASQTGWIKAGDVFKYDGYPGIYVATADADSDGLGDVAIPCVPEIRTSPADAVDVKIDATISALWILEDKLSWGSSAMSRLKSGDARTESLTLNFIEDINGE